MNTTSEQHHGAPAAPDPRAARGARPAPARALRFTAGDLILVVLLNGALVVAMWIRHGGLNQLGSASVKLTAAGQLTALVGTYATLVQVLLMSRSPWLERRFGMDGLAQWQRWLGFIVTYATAGFAMGEDGIAWVAAPPGYDVYGVTADGRVRYSEGFAALIAPSTPPG